MPELEPKSQSHSLLGRVFGLITSAWLRIRERPGFIFLCTMFAVISGFIPIYKDILSYTGRTIVLKSDVATAKQEHMLLSESNKNILSQRIEIYAQKSLISHLKRENALLEGKQVDFSSLVSEGLWDHGQPSPGSFLDARSIKGALGNQVVAALQSSHISAPEKAMVVVAVDEYIGLRSKCNLYSDRLDIAKAYQQTFAPTPSPTPSEERPPVVDDIDAVEIGTAEAPDERVADAAVTEKKVMVKECIDHLAESLNQLRDTLSQIKSEK